MEAKMVHKRRPVKFDDRAEATVVHHLEPLEEDPRQLWFSVRTMTGGYSPVVCCLDIYHCL